MVRLTKKPKDFLQETIRKDEMTVKNSILRTYQRFKDKTKKESKELLKSMEGNISGIENKEIKKLTLEELDSLILFINRNLDSV
jgi:hypothetical protein